MNLATFSGLVRPFTLLAPVVGAGSGAAVAVAATGVATPWGKIALALASACAATCASNAWNQAFDADIDRVNKPFRPIPSGRMSAREGLIFALLIFALGFVELYVFTNLLTALLALATLAIYAFAYTPLKKKGPIATWVGAVPGALPPLMGWTAATGGVDAPALVLFAILFLWQLPHFLALAWIYRDDYGRAGLSLVPGPRAMSIQMLAPALVLLPVSLLLVPIGAAGMFYGIGAAVAGVGFCAFAARAARRIGQREARQLFLASIVYLPIVLLFIAGDRFL